MAQPPPQQQQHYAHSPSPYSPGDNIHSPAGTPQGFAQPPSKRQKLSPNPSSQPSTPYAPSPYGASPSGSTHASPHFTHIQIPPSAYAGHSAPLAPSPSTSYSTPYSNGHTPTSGLPPPQHQPNFQPTAYPSPLGHPNHTQSPQQGNYNSYAMPPPHPGAMGPPLKPADKLRDDVDPMDVLGGTGVNLQEEEQFMFQINNNNSFSSHLSGSQLGTVSSGHSFTQFPPGNEASFYGAGPANAVAEATNTKSQDEYLKKVADKVWTDAAHALATSRAKELNNPFLDGRYIHRRIANIAEKHGLVLNREDGNMGFMKRPETFHREIRAQIAHGPDATMAATNGTFLPNDTQLIDQAALLSISLKHRLRELLEDVYKISRGRQTGSHGIISEDWVNVAIESGGSTSNSVTNGTTRAGWENADSPRSIPFKRSSSAANVSPPPTLENVKKGIGKLQIQNGVVTALRTAATKERDAEEARLKKRQERAAGDGATRQGSVAPGTPGSIAPDPMEKAPTKKEQKKKQESKASEAATHAAANVTTAQFLGGGGGIFGKKKKYSWMTGGGGPGSGASTPGRLTTGGLPSTPGGTVQPPVPERLTAEPARRLGQWREDQPKGNRIQLRDWVAVLEQDGQAKKPLQKAYMFLDVSEPKGS